MDEKKQKIIQMQVRMPAELRDRIREEAERDHRSINGEIIEAIERFLGKKK